MDIGALSIMTYGFRDREQILAFFEKTTGVRMNHNFIRPGGRRGRSRARLASRRQGHPRKHQGDGGRLRRHAQGEPDLERAHPRRRGHHLAKSASPTASPARRCAQLAVDWDLRKAFPYAGHRAVRIRGPARITRGMSTTAIESGSKRCCSQPGLSSRPPRRCRKATTAPTIARSHPPPRMRIDESMEALIHHFKIFTEGFRVPAGETYVAVESPRGELGCYLVSTGDGNPYRMHTGHLPSTTCRRLPIMMADSRRGRHHRHHRLARPGDGRRRPMIDRQVGSGLARPVRRRLAQLRPRGHRGAVHATTPSIAITPTTNRWWEVRPSPTAGSRSRTNQGPGTPRISRIWSKATGQPRLAPPPTATAGSTATCGSFDFAADGRCQRFVEWFMRRP